MSQRQRVLNEILTTERDYVNHLKIMIESYKIPLKESGVITEEQQKTLFANLDDIWLLNKNSVLVPFENILKSIDDPYVDWSQVDVPIGEVFISLSEHLRQYTEYCSKQPLALAMLDELQRENEEYEKFQKEVLSNPSLKGLTLLSFLIKPVQRLCKYPLLLKELMNNTKPDLPDYKKLEEAFSKLCVTVDYVNDMQRKAEETQQAKHLEIVNIEACIDGAETIDLAGDPNRVITNTGDVYRVTKKKVVPRKLYLFNNLILLAKPKKKFKKGKDYKLDWNCKISNVAITDIANNEEINIVNGFELKSRSEDDVVVICCESLEVKRNWVNSIKVHIKDHQKQEAKRRKVTQLQLNYNLTSSHSQLSRSGNGEKRNFDNILKTGSLPVLPTLSQNTPVHLKYTKESIPPPPADDGDINWRKEQEEEKLNYYPPYFIIPPRWNDWLQYTDNGIPFYYHTKTKESVWEKPEGWIDVA